MKKQMYVMAIFVAAMIIGIIFVLPKGTTVKNSNLSNPTNQGKAIECDRDADCLAGGCSGHLCMPRDKASSAITTCEWKDEYACYQQDTCLCRNNTCAWGGSQKFQECMRQLR